MKGPKRSILHLDLDPFFVAVERSLDEALRGRPVVIGGAGHGFVAAASDEARHCGVRVGMPLAEAHRLCPGAVLRPGDLETYGRVSEQVTSVLLAASRRVERPSVDEAFIDLTPEPGCSTPPIRAAEAIRDDLQRRLGLDVSLGLASSRLAARIASNWARPRGLLVVLPGYEPSFLAGKPISTLDLPPHVESALERASIATLGDLAACDESRLAASIGPAARRVQAIARGEEEPPIAVLAPPIAVQEEASVRDRRSDHQVLVEMADALARRAVRRLKPFRLCTSIVGIEVRRANDTSRDARLLRPALADEDAVASVARMLAAPLLLPAEGVRAIQVRLSRLAARDPQVPLFPAAPGAA